MNKKSTVALSTGNHMPVIGLGTWQLDKDTSGTIIEAIKLGYTMIDTSGDYGTQPGIGEGIKHSTAERHNLYIVTKVEETDNAYRATRKNLEELDVEYADLMLIHRPPREGTGKKLWEGLVRARTEGLTKDIGVSNYSVEQIEELVAEVNEMPVVNQIEWSPLGHDLQMLDFCRENEIIIQAYSPLTRQEQLDHPTITEIADEHGKTPAQVMVRWNLQLGTVPLPKANSLDHLRQNIDVFDFELSEDEMAELNNLNKHFSALGRLQYV
jgi:2,5-diketo-D-gluconate reductase A